MLSSLLRAIGFGQTERRPSSVFATLGTTVELDQRLVLAANVVGAVLQGDTVTITGTSRGDRVLVEQTPEQMVTVTVNGNLFQFGQPVNNIVATLGNGHDIFEMLRGVTARATVYGGNGNDILIGGSMNDLLYGGNGNDKIDGRGGDDLLFGDAGKDAINGGDGNDKLYGGNGIDTLRGGLDVDYLEGGKGWRDIVYRRPGVDTVFNPWKPADTLLIDDSDVDVIPPVVRFSSGDFWATQSYSAVFGGQVGQRTTADVGLIVPAGGTTVYSVRIDGHFGGATAFELYRSATGIHNVDTLVPTTVSNNADGSKTFYFTAPITLSGGTTWFQPRFTNLLNGQGVSVTGITFETSSPAMADYELQINWIG